MLPIGETILLWRLERRLSQKELAERAGVSRPNLSAIERGKRELSLKTLRALALELGLRPGILADGEGPRAKSEIESSRETLERIADGVVSAKPVRPKEKELVELLEILTYQRTCAAAKSRRRLPLRKRTVSRAWLRLASGYSSQTISSLIQRIADRQRINPPMP